MRTTARTGNYFNKPKRPRDRAGRRCSTNRINRRFGRPKYFPNYSLVVENKSSPSEDQWRDTKYDDLYDKCKDIIKEIGESTIMIYLRNSNNTNKNPSAASGFFVQLDDEIYIMSVMHPFTAVDSEINKAYISKTEWWQEDHFEMFKHEHIRNKIENGNNFIEIEPVTRFLDARKEVITHFFKEKEFKLFLKCGVFCRPALDVILYHVPNEMKERVKVGKYMADLKQILSDENDKSNENENENENGKWKCVFLISYQNVWGGINMKSDYLYEFKGKWEGCNEEDADKVNPYTKDATFASNDNFICRHRSVSIGEISQNCESFYGITNTAVDQSSGGIYFTIESSSIKKDVKYVGMQIGYIPDLLEPECESSIKWIQDHQFDALRYDISDLKQVEKEFLQSNKNTGIDNGPFNVALKFDSKLFKCVIKSLQSKLAAQAAQAQAPEQEQEETWQDEPPKKKQKAQDGTGIQTR